MCLPTSKTRWFHQTRAHNLTCGYPPQIWPPFLFWAGQLSLGVTTYFWCLMPQQSYTWLPHLYFLCTDHVGLWLKRWALTYDSASLSSPNLLVSRPGVSCLDNMPNEKQKQFLHSLFLPCLASTLAQPIVSLSALGRSLLGCSFLHSVPHFQLFPFQLQGHQQDTQELPPWQAVLLSQSREILKSKNPPSNSQITQNLAT